MCHIFMPTFKESLSELLRSLSFPTNANSGSTSPNASSFSSISWYLWLWLLKREDMRMLSLSQNWNVFMMTGPSSITSTNSSCGWFWIGAKIILPNVAN